jgi:hypothetical protein
MTQIELTQVSALYASGFPLVTGSSAVHCNCFFYCQSVILMYKYLASFEHVHGEDEKDLSMHDLPIDSEFTSSEAFDL